MENDRTIVRNFINDCCIVRVPPGSKALPSYMGWGSGYYTWQFYLRRALYHPMILGIIVRDILTKYEDQIEDIQICGVESSSTPLLTALAVACYVRGININVFSIRQSQKAYGLKNWIEGRVIAGKPALMVDDIISPLHKTAIHGATILKQEGIPMAPHVYALVYKTMYPTMNRITLADQTVTVGSMFCLNDFDLELKDYKERKHNG